LFELDWERECIVAGNFPVTLMMFKAQVTDFLKKLLKKLGQVDKNEEWEQVKK
jgi:hypothetical protein